MKFKIVSVCFGGFGEFLGFLVFLRGWCCCCCLRLFWGSLQKRKVHLDHLYLLYCFFLILSCLPYPKSGKSILSEYVIFIIHNKLMHIPGTVTVPITDNAYCMQLELWCYSPEWLWDPDHINSGMNFGNDKIKSHLSQTVYQYAVAANVRKYHSLYKQ